MRRPEVTLSILLLLSVFAAGCAATQHDLLYEGMARYGAGRDEEAVAILTEAAAKPGPELPWVYKMRAGAYQRLGRYDLALADLDRFFPGAADNEDRAHGHLMRGNIHFAMGRFDLAEADFERSLELNPSKWHTDALKSLDALDEIARSGAGRGWLGSALRSPPAGEPGVPVIHVVPDSPAEKAGVRSGDVILACDDTPVTGPLEFARQIASAATGTTVRLDILRGATKIRVTAVLEELAYRKEERRYLAMPVKPPLPEEARKYRVQAEAAVERKSFEEATDRYRDALRVAPWWPEGHYNRALLLAEMSRHALAVREMKRYLLLAPGAPDARAAQDQIYKWEALVKR